MKIMVTGGAGFIGSHLCEKLISQGHYVICVDNLSSGSKENIATFLGNSNFHFLNIDIIDLKEIYEIDQVYNLACPASPKFYQSMPVQTLLTSVIGVYNILKLAKKYKIPMLHASTSEIYGDPLEHPQQETYFGNVNPIGIRACYDEGKRAAETLCYDFIRCYQTEVRIARIFNTYGPKMKLNDGRVISNFVVQSLRNQPITIFGDGDQTRSLCYISDLIEGLILLMNSQEKINHPINLGNPDERKIMDIARLIHKLSNSKSQFTNVELPFDDPRQRKPSIDRARKILGWSPKVKLENGINLTLEYFRKKLLTSSES